MKTTYLRATLYAIPLILRNVLSDEKTQKIANRTGQWPYRKLFQILYRRTLDTYKQLTLK